jgi:multidrug efflux pump subunit AcrA (membrane-fusion protein)
MNKKAIINWFSKTSWKEKFSGIKNIIVHSSWKKRIIFLVIILVVGFSAKYFIDKSQNNKTTYQTALVEKGTLINSISGSGSVTSGNYTNVTTRVSGIVSKVYVTNGDTVVKGQKIAEVILDDYAKERQTAAWVAYLDATVAVRDALTAKVTADIDMWKARETLLNAQTDANNNKGATDGERMVTQKTLDQSRLAFSSAEQKYLNADSDIANTRAKVSAALRDYQTNSATIVAPVSGVITDLSLAQGLVVSASSTTSQTSGATIVSSQTIGKINDPKGQLVATVSLTEIDVIKVKANQKVTITLDAYADKTFTGKVLAVNTSGSSNSGVTSYPVSILLDPVTTEIYPNMGVNVNIITDIKTDVLLVPSSAIQTSNNQTTVRILKNNQVVSVPIEIGNANDTQTEIISGLNEGDSVITSIISSAILTTTGTTPRSGTTSSPFGSMGGGGMGGAVRNFQGSDH